MTLEERYELSCYEPVLQIHDRKNVWLVRHNEEGSLYIKKVIEMYNRDIYERLMEIQPANVPKIVMCVEDDSRLIVIEEYIHGVSLEKKLEENGVFSREAVLKLMINLCDIIKPLHDSIPPIIHRDIKPSNIMISNDGVIKLVDFNAAKEFKTSQNEDTRLMGTRHFAAPEQYGFGQSDQRTDIYAMGVTMYYLLTGEFPAGHRLKGKIGEIIDKCISLDKNNRYQSVDILKAALKDALKDDLKTHLFLPVGFRTGVLWKRLMAFCGCALSVWLCANLEITGSSGQPLTGYVLLLNRIAAFIMIMGTILFVGNFLGVKNRLPLMGKNKILTGVMTVVYLAVYYMVVVGLLVLMGG